ncbi:hypothetical protein NOR_00919 [Metarhizium rileyi]|uniref:Uncharacterized protein n=1 Tax=Metarhizium rileyi (strain RCEF 4871) TaxID=1649241 RepID=A0A167JLS3_METRR|nr:hypothetical protein NOR_00919 [Metarhizium rileyi RCEF 4871]
MDEPAAGSRAVCRTHAVAAGSETAKQDNNGLGESPRLVQHVNEASEVSSITSSRGDKAKPTASTASVVSVTTSRQGGLGNAYSVLQHIGHRCLTRHMCDSVQLAEPPQTKFATHGPPKLGSEISVLAAPRLVLVVPVPYHSASDIPAVRPSPSFAASKRDRKVMGRKSDLTEQAPFSNIENPAERRNPVSARRENAMFLSLKGNDPLAAGIPGRQGGV